MTNIIKKIFKTTAFFWAMFILPWGLAFLYFGNVRVSMGIDQLEDHYISHYARVGLTYLNLSLIILIIFSVVITYLVMKYKK
ncbi:hypothetical protein JW949_03610 [Candidatus Woesearchaeota archaeon]|nr:hypothetical protein [Candidatus Woesearchaeota archaeon]